MMQKILSFFMAIVAFFMQLLGLGGKKNYNDFRDISFGSDPNQVVDLAVPTNAGTETSLFVYIHGGAWIGGDEDDGWEIVKYCAQDLKLAAASLNYRFLSEGGGVHCREMLDDITSGLKAAVNKAAEQGVKVNSLAIGGTSAGAHLALLYAYLRSGESPVPIKFVYSEVGPADFTGRTFLDGCTGMDKALVLSLLSELSGTTVTNENIETAAVQNALKAVSPVTYVTPISVPTLMAYGAKDDIVPIEIAHSLDNALNKAGVKHDLFMFPNSGHNLDADKSVRKAYNAKLLEYIRTYLY